MLSQSACASRFSHENLIDFTAETYYNSGGEEGKSVEPPLREGSVGARPRGLTAQPPQSLRVKTRRISALKKFKRSYRNGTAIWVVPQVSLSHVWDGLLLF